MAQAEVQNDASLAAVTTILLVRHGETDWNRDNRFQGHADPPLNEAGREQAVDLAARLAGEELTAVYSSPLLRALETAEIVAAAHGLTPVAVDALKEVDVGSWEGLTRDEVAERYPEQYARWRDRQPGPGDGETYEALRDRVIPALLEVAAAHPNGRVLAVTHGGPIRVALAYVDAVDHSEARRLRPTIANGSLVEIAVEDAKFSRPA
jgi:broad specificity phosphatase PhoE